ncbi:unnamed protein product [Closterium sp. NIES-65]|nr:unnamed protein product [Closterium sp. NIES-65]
MAPTQPTPPLPLPGGVHSGWEWQKGAAEPQSTKNPSTHMLTSHIPTRPFLPGGVHSGREWQHGAEPHGGGQEKSPTHTHSPPKPSLLPSPRLPPPPLPQVVFIVDASGSMALNRMGAAKGAALQLLAESYSKRDSIAVVPFHDQHADLLVPPSRAVALAHKRLESLPCGGGSPLAHALVVAVRAAEVARRRGDVGQVVAVLITDGRANVPLSASLEALEGGGGGGEGATGAGGEEKLPPRLEDIKEEVLSIAAKMGAAGIQLLVIDTENKFVSSGFAKEIAKHSQGEYS